MILIKSVRWSIFVRISMHKWGAYTPKLTKSWLECFNWDCDDSMHRWEADIPKMVKILGFRSEDWVRWLIIGFGEYDWVWWLEGFEWLMVNHDSGLGYHYWMLGQKANTSKMIYRSAAWRIWITVHRWEAYRPKRENQLWGWGSWHSWRWRWQWWDRCWWYPPDIGSQDTASYDHDDHEDDNDADADGFHLI